MIISFLATIIGVLVTGTQALLIHLQGEGICLNEGCEIVDSLTKVEPFFFNIFGFCFFLLASLGINRARKGSELWSRFVSILLLAALAAEGVLLSFQLFVTEAFCSYCLIILALVVIANLFMGLKQLFKGLVVFSAVVIASASLNYGKNGEHEPVALKEGSLARYEVENSTGELYFFFSSNCKYCEQVLESLDEASTCTINFNPVDTIDSFSFAGASASLSYRPKVNRDYLFNLGIKGVPVLQAEQDGSLTIVRGATGIMDFLAQYCGQAQTEELASIPEQTKTTTPVFPLLSTEDGCLPEEACEDDIGTMLLQNEQSLPTTSQQ